MNQKTNKKLQQLRAEAESRLLGESSTESATQAVEKLLYELQVHQVELEIQNEELRRAHADVAASRDRYFDLFEFAPIGYLTLTSEGLVAEINLTGATLLGVERSNIIHRRFAGFIVNQDKDRWYRLFLNIMANAEKENHQIDLKLNRSDGSIIYANLDCLRRSEADAPPSIRIALTDITELKKAQINLNIAATAFESQDGIFITDANTVILKVNEAFTKITGYSAEEAIGKTPRILKSGRHDKDFYTAMWNAIQKTGSWHGEVWNRRKNGEIYPERQTISAVFNDKGEVHHYVSTLTDITREKAASNQIKQLAFFDPLTNLPNRRLLKDRLHLALASSTRSKQQGALLFIDLDNFKTLNDTLGHDMGDLLLKQVGERLENCLREGDTAARLGGDEFVVMLEDLSTSPEESAIHAEIAGNKILAALSEPYVLADRHYRCTSSIGITLFNNHVLTEDDLLKHVDIAMYQAKHEGRNTLCFFDQSMQAALSERAAMETDLRIAPERDQFELYYQLQTTTYENDIVDIEVLVRWQHPKHGLILPMEFIPLAEETGLIMPIGQWVLETACAQLKKWANNPQTKHLQLAVNVSANQFHQTDFVDKINAVVKKTAINPNRLKLELTENVVLSDIDDTILKMHALKAVGIRMSLDDFGTGYSSLSYLTQLPFDQIKIDQSFIHNIGVKHTDSVIVQTIIGMAKNLGMEVVAEGVETEAQRDFLNQHGCHLCQGYLFSKPMPIEEFEVLLSKQRLS